MQRKRFEYGTWSWIILSGATVSAAVFAVWQVLQQNYFQDLDYRAQREDLQFIQRQLCYGKEVVESLLRFSRPSREIKRTEPLNRVLQGVLNMMESTAWNRKVQLVHDWRATEAALVYVGRNQLEQVLVHLCDNALDAMPQGGELTMSTQVQQDRSRSSRSKCRRCDSVSAICRYSRNILSSTPALATTKTSMASTARHSIA